MVARVVLYVGQFSMQFLGESGSLLSAIQQQLVLKISDGPHFSPNYVSREEGIPFISARNIKVNGWELDSAKYVSVSDHKEFTKRAKVNFGDILYTKGGTTGIAKVNDLDFEFSVWVHVAVLNIFHEGIFNHYLTMALNSPNCYDQSQRLTQGISNNDLGLTRMIHISIPLPPLAEQIRIVAKVNDLVELCDRLRYRLTDVIQLQKNISDVIVERAVA